MVNELLPNIKYYHAEQEDYIKKINTWLSTYLSDLWQMKKEKYNCLDFELWIMDLMDYRCDGLCM